MASTDEVLSRILEPFATWPDLFDVLLVTFVLYNLLLLIRGTRAAQVVLGILLVVLAYGAARTFRLPALEATLERFFTILPLAILVLFQHEIRRALASFGRTPGWRFGRDGQDLRELFNDVAVAAATLSERRIGALIAFERRDGLRNYIENGIQIDAIVSLDLLIPLFHTDAAADTHSELAHFHRPVDPAAVVTDVTSAWSLEATKVELRCSMCGAHLGYVDPGQDAEAPLVFKLKPTALVFTATGSAE